MKRVTLSVTLGILALVLGFATSAFSQSDPSNQGNRDKLVVKRSFDQWEYYAFQNEGGTYITISSPIKGKSALAKLLKAHKDGKGRLLQAVPHVPTIVIPEKPLATDALANFVKKHNIVVKSYTLVAQAANGDVITIFGAPSETELFPQQELQTTVSSVEANQNTTLQIKGVVAIEAQVNDTSFTSLDADPSVLGVDLTPALAVADFAQQYTEVDVATIRVVPGPLYWAAREP